MEVTLPFLKKTAVLKEWMPHGVAAKVNEAMYKGVEIGQQSFSVTNATLMDHFGAEVMQKVDDLPEKEREKRLQEMKEEYLQSKLEVKGMQLGNIEEANLCRLEGMVESIDGAKPDRKMLNDLPHKDFEFLLEQIAEIENAEEAANLSEPSGA